ncbi:phosphate acyltransferase [Coralliovum pocilloporae]|uniref:phosphate acyltransferase n=1 Tax=Coralliovum pocilloporae TaxID=3066369 RepID=UPI0033075A42
MTDTSPFLSSDSAACPPELLALARQRPPVHIAVVRAGAPLPMIAAKEAVEAGLMVPVLIGEKDDIRREADALDWDISPYELIETRGEAAAAVAAGQLIRSDHVGAVLKGQLHSDVYMKALLARETGLRSGNRLIHVFHMTMPDGGKPLLITDAAMNVSPDLETRKDAIRLVGGLSKRLGAERPRIAVLSATETPIASMPSSLEGRELEEWARDAVPDMDVRGPLALDLILSHEAARIKGLGDDPVAGQADAVVVPDIVSGNTLFKALVYCKGACAAGVILGGKVPVLLTSRADPPAARLASIALASILSDGQNDKNNSNDSAVSGNKNQ